ncbi:DNA repair protein RecO [Ehrlichia ruminantium]|uniref:DNA repair protein RecO n=1 Tax=Ehrlichia ruminantium TaxID=779 RepID=UPI00004C7829|nr:DNA repair protein RecO [Ehrlichia ruminantium]QLK50569.1 DNA repair protein RecO [Ehrlichia ruminantium]QLK51494.1 DNA repair protein RecO [Ehrlichia ruminantium]QLK58829.1 DNA repair protein RecO [Ehrlichia ruminantium]CAI27957.1 Putative DNA repair protein recO [Ehrlichia ruminantium str. Gardel]
MRWQDQGIVIAIRKYCDNQVIISVLTKKHGLKKGLTKYYKKTINRLQIGDYINVTWSARLISNLGYFKYELIKSTIYYYMTNNLQTLCLAFFTFILDQVLPENEENYVIYHYFDIFINSIQSKNINWQIKYLKLEMVLLSELGFGLDLSKCAVNQTQESLIFISPKTGKAISKNIGLPYKKKLLPLPQLLYNIYNNYTYEFSNTEFKLSLNVLGYFFKKHFLTDKNITFLKYREEIIKLLDTEN